MRTSPLLAAPHALLALLFSMTLGCAGGYHISHDSEVYASQDEDWCEAHQTAHHTRGRGHRGGGHRNVEIVVEHDEPHYEEVYVEEVSGGYRDDSSGYTACGTFFAQDGAENSCHPGQYCADSTFSKCASGCLSDVNCAGHETCDKSRGSKVGSCRSAGYYGSR